MIININLSLALLLSTGIFMLATNSPSQKVESSLSTGSLRKASILSHRGAAKMAMRGNSLP
jgi:hypothetical protein